MQKIMVAALFILGCHVLSAQTRNDTTKVTPFNLPATAPADLYYGIEHTGYHQQMNGTPYFETAEWQKGSVTFNNVVYNDVLLKYDLLTDELIALHPNGFFPVTIINERVQAFSIGHHEFVNVPETNAAGLKAPGFYHVLVSGRLSILVKRNKLIEEKTSAHGVERTVVAKQQYYTLKDGVASPVTTEESVTRLLGEHARLVRTHLRAREIKFRKHKELALFEIANYYNQLAK